MVGQLLDGLDPGGLCGPFLGWFSTKLRGLAPCLRELHLCRLVRTGAGSGQVRVCSSHEARSKDRYLLVALLFSSCLPHDSDFSWAADSWLKCGDPSLKGPT